MLGMLHDFNKFNYNQGDDFEAKLHSCLWMQCKFQCNADLWVDALRNQEQLGTPFHSS